MGNDPMLADETGVMIKTLRNPGPGARQFADFLNSVADRLESLSSAVPTTDDPACMNAVASNEPCDPDETKLRCTICGFIVDTRFKAEKPAADYTNAGRTKKSAVPTTEPVAETRAITEDDRQYASELLADLNNDDLPRLEIAARWFRKARVEHALSTAAPVAEATEGVREALEFYADPFAWKKKNDPDDVVQIPDFYSETSFGDTAVEALAALPAKDGAGSMVTRPQHSPEAE